MRHHRIASAKSLGKIHSPHLQPVPAIDIATFG
jgi:hypothetical protein